MDAEKAVPPAGRPNSAKRVAAALLPLVRSLALLVALAFTLAAILMSIERPPEKDRQAAQALRLKHIEETVLMRYSLMHAMPDMSSRYPSCRYSCEACYPKPADDEDGIRVDRTMWYKSATDECTAEEVSAFKAAVAENETLWNIGPPHTPQGPVVVVETTWCIPLCIYEFPSVAQVEACRLGDAAPTLNPLEFNETCLDKSTADCPNCNLLTTRLPELAYAIGFDYTEQKWVKATNVSMQTAEVYTLMKKELEAGVEPTNWDLKGSLFFAVTILTTIGYGNYAPSMETSRLVIVLFTLPLVAAFGFALAELSDLITEAATTLLATIVRATAKYRTRRTTQGENSLYVDGTEAIDAWLSMDGVNDTDASLSNLQNDLRRERRVMASFEASATQNNVKITEGLTFDEFSLTLRGMREVSELPVDDERWRKALFDEFDTDKSGHLDTRELAVMLSKVMQRIDAKKNEVLAQFRIAATVVLALLILAIGSLAFWGLSDGWTFLDAVYFTFITLTTIGLGDFVPSHGAMMVAWYFVTLSGLGIFGALVSNVGAVFNAQAELAKLNTE